MPNRQDLLLFNSVATGQSLKTLVSPFPHLLNVYHVQIAPKITYTKKTLYQNIANIY